MPCPFRRSIRSGDIAVWGDVLSRCRGGLARIAASAASRGAGMFSAMAIVRSTVWAKHDGSGAPACGWPAASLGRSRSLSIRAFGKPVGDIAERRLQGRRGNHRDIAVSLARLGGRSAGLRFRRSRCHFVRCSSQCRPTAGRRFTPKCIERCGNILMAARSCSALP
jgi:hypothetical protein